MAIYYPPIAATFCPPFDVLCIPETCYSRIRERVYPLYTFLTWIYQFHSTSTLRTVNSLSVMNLYLWIEKFKSFVNCFPT